MKKVFTLIACIGIGLTCFSQAKYTIVVKDSVPVLKVTDDFINYNHIQELEEVLKQVLVNPEFIKMNPIDQYNKAVSPVILAIINKAQKEWIEKQKKKGKPNK